MKKLITLTLLLSFIYFDVYGQHISSNFINEEKWKCEITFENNLGPFNTILYFAFEDSSFTAHSTKNADKRIFGSTKAIIARLLKKSPKKGIFIKITDGRVVSKANIDSLFGIIHLPVFGGENFKAIKLNDSIFGSILDSNKIIGHIFGINSEMGFNIDYKELSQRIIDTTKKYIYNPDLLHNKQWKRFNKKINKLSINTIDDIEFFLGFNILNQKLAFSHYNLFLFSENPDFTKESHRKYLVLKEIGKNTVYLNIKSFAGSSREMDSIFNIILNNNYENLIIDLRNNSGGGLNSAIAFGRYLSPKELNAGYFVTNKWHFEKEKTKGPLDFSRLPVTDAVTTTAFIEELKHTIGQQLVIAPGEKTFKGNVYILTSKITASTCEPIVYALKKNKLATIVGERTAGAMLSATIFHISDKYYIFLPIADYYTSDGQRLDQIGVKPNVIVNPKDALNFVINNLIK